MPPSKRIAYTDVSYRLIEEWLKNPIRHHDIIWQTNLPKDASIYRVVIEDDQYTMNRRDIVRIYWQSVAFAEVPEGAYPPAFDLFATTSVFIAPIERKQDRT